ncbi:MAG TPA: alpha/beta fold hydrolase [Planctomycetota bacterium]
MWLLPLLLAFLQEPATLPGPYHAGQEARWTIEQAGERIGDGAARYEGEVDLGGLRAHLFREQVRLVLAAPGSTLEQRFTMELWTGVDGRPLRFDFRAQVGDARTVIEGLVANGQVELAVQQGPAVRSQSFPLAPEAFLLANNFVGHIELVLALSPVEASRTVTLFSVNLGQAFPYVLRRVEELPGGAILEDSLGERLHFVAGRLERVEIPAQEIVFQRVEEPVARFEIERPTRPGADEGLEREEVRIDDGPVSLAGTLTRPRGATGRLPALTFLSGSGLQDREGFAAGMDLGTHEILDHLTRAGFLVLRVDDRGAGESTGPMEGLTFDDLVADGRRVLHYLRARPDVDPERVALLGHSEGGLSAPILAAEGGVAAVVLLAAPGRPIDVLLREQLLAGRAAAGASEAELERFGQEMDAFLKAVAAGKPPPAAGLAPELAVFVPRHAWLKSHIGRDPLAVLARVACPVLVLQGGCDVQVLADRDMPALAGALVQHPDHEVRRFPTLDHLFKVASDPPSSLDYLRARPVDAEFLAVLTEWLTARLAPE